MLLAVVGAMAGWGLSVALAEPAGCTIRWADRAAGDWDDPSSWVPQRVPDGTDHACFAPLGEAAGVHLASASAVRALTVEPGAEVSLSASPGGSLAVAEGAVVDGELDAVDLPIAIGGDLGVDGGASLSGATLSVGGDVVSPGSLQSFGGSLAIAGGWTHAGSASVGGSIVEALGGVANHGILDLADVTLTAPSLANTGDLRVLPASMAVDHVDNRGVLSGPGLSLDGSTLTNTGSIRVRVIEAPGLAVANRGGDLRASQVTGLSALEVDRGYVQASHLEVTGGPLAIHRGLVRVDQTVVRDGAFVQDGGELRSCDPLLAGLLDVLGECLQLRLDAAPGGPELFRPDPAVVVLDDVTLTLSGGLLGDVIFDVSGQVLVTTDLPAGGTLDIDPAGQAVVRDGFVNDGTIVVAGDYGEPDVVVQPVPLVVSDPATRLENHGVLDLRPSNGAELVSVGVGTLDNRGVANVVGVTLDAESIRNEGSMTLALTEVRPASIVNTGTLGVSEAVLVVPRVDNDGVLTIGSSDVGVRRLTNGRYLRVDDSSPEREVVVGHLGLPASSSTVVGARLRVLEPVDAAGRLEILELGRLEAASLTTSGTVTVVGAIVADVVNEGLLTLSGGTIEGAVANDGALVPSWFGAVVGSLANRGTLDLSASGPQSLLVEGDVALHPEGRVLMDVRVVDDGTRRHAEADLLGVVGHVDLGGRLLLAAENVSSGDQFTLVHHGSAAGSLAPEQVLADGRDRVDWLWSVEPEQYVVTVDGVRCGESAADGVVSAPFQDLVEPVPNDRTHTHRATCTLVANGL